MSVIGDDMTNEKENIRVKRHVDSAESKLTELKSVVDSPVIIVNSDLIKFAPWNYKDDDEEKAAALLNSFKTLGYISKMVVAERLEEPGVYEVIDGNHRLMTIHKLGLSEVQVVFVGMLDKESRILRGMVLNELRFHTNFDSYQALTTDLLQQFNQDVLIDLGLPTFDFVLDSTSILDESFDGLNSDSSGEDNDNSVVTDRLDLTLHLKVSRETYKKYIRLTDSYGSDVGESERFEMFINSVDRVKET